MNSALRFAFVALTGLVLFMFFMNPNDEAGGDGQQIKHPPATEPPTRAAYTYCDLKTDAFEAQFTTRGATLKNFTLVTPKYRRDGKPYNVSTTPQPGVEPGTPAEQDPNATGSGPAGMAHEYRQQLFAQFRNVTSKGVPDAPDWNLTYDSVDWKLSESTDTACKFSYDDATVRLTKTIETTERPYELKVRTSIQNRASTKRLHAFALDTTAWWFDEQVESKMFRVSPYITHVECFDTEGQAHRKLPTDFEPGSFDEPEFSATGAYRWYQPTGKTAFAAVSNAYFSHAIVPLDEDATPACQLQVEYRKNPATPNFDGAFYRARLAYPARSLAPGEEATYEALSYIGPKERAVLAQAGGGDPNLLELIDLGFFSAIARVLVSFLLKVYSFVPNWGIAIIVLTLVARTLLFPLSIPGIRMSMKMRALRPEVERLNDKYKDDARAKGVATMELWRKHGISPFDQLKGCVPQLATMPVWFALYTTLQTAVELYNIPFLWFPDLSQADPYFVLPLVIGGVFFVQQKLMPMQGDPAQQKMLMYFMPAMMTVFMLFLPSGLGVYMFTNSLLVIVQQQVVERIVKKNASKGQVVVSEDTAAKPTKRQKGKAGA